MPLLSVSMPSLPAAKQITRSWWFQTVSSISLALGSYGRPGCVAPHEFVCTRALLLVYGGVKRSCRSAGIPPRLPPESSSDCTTSVARGAVPLITPPIKGELPSPSTAPQTWVPCPPGSSAFAGLVLRGHRASRHD